VPSPSPVTDKKDMYRRLAAGEFGNVIPQYFTIREWLDSGVKYALWGVRHTVVSGFPGTRLDVPSADVERVVREGGFGEQYNISPMVHRIGNIQWEGDVARLTTGLVCSGNVGPAPGSWRRHMLTPRLWERSAAVALLAQVLNVHSLADVTRLLDDYPDHVIELSALDCCFGTLPGRNAVVWEVRRY
jgi:hypothetical protein